MNQNVTKNPKSFNIIKCPSEFLLCGKYIPIPWTDSEWSLYHLLYNFWWTLFLCDGDPSSWWSLVMESAAWQLTGKPLLTRLCSLDLKWNSWWQLTANAHLVFFVCFSAWRSESDHFFPPLQQVTSYETSKQWVQKHTKLFISEGRSQYFLSFFSSSSGAVCLPRPLLYLI